MKVKAIRCISIFLGILIISALFPNPVLGQLETQKPGPGVPPEKSLPALDKPVLDKAKPGVPSQPVPGQRVPGITPAKPIPVQAKPEVIRTFRRPAIPFKPFTYSDFKDPNTGQTLKPDQMITLRHFTPPKQIRGDQFLSEVNQFEKYYNSYGYTHRDRGEVVIGEVIFNKALLKSQADRINSKSIKFNPAMKTKPMDSQTFQRMHQENINLASTVSQELKQASQKTGLTSSPKQKSTTLKEAQRSVGPPEFKPISIDEHWNETYGDPGTIAVHQKMDILHDGKKERLSTTANNELGITLFNNYFTLVGATANFTAPGPDTADSNVGGNWHIRTLQGKIVRNVNIPSASNYFYPRQKTTIIDVPPQFVGIPIPTPVTVRIGYGGRIDIWLEFSITPLAINFTIEPDVQLTTAFQFGVGLLIVEVGIQGNTLILRDTPKLIGELSVKPYTPPVLPPGMQKQPVLVEPGQYVPPGPKLVFNAVAQCMDSIEALKGTVYLYFKVYLIFYEKTWKTRIYEGNEFIGIDRYLINKTGREYYYG